MWIVPAAIGRRFPRGVQANNIDRTSPERWLRCINKAGQVARNHDGFRCELARPDHLRDRPVQFLASVQFFPALRSICGVSHSSVRFAGSERASISPRGMSLPILRAETSFSFPPLDARGLQQRKRRHQMMMPQGRVFQLVGEFSRRQPGTAAFSSSFRAAGLARFFLRQPVRDNDFK